MTLKYTPINLTEAGKILEDIIRDKLVKFLEENIMLSNTQYCFKNK